MRIKQLNCSDAKIHHLLPLRELNFLKDLNCSNNPIDNLEPLQNIHFLATLNCSKTQIYSLEPVRRLSLKELDCSETQISSLSPLWNMNDLKLLNCRNTQIHQSEIEQFKRRCPQCKVITDFQIDLEIIKPVRSELLSEGRISITTAKGWWQLDEEWKKIFRRIANFTEQPSQHDLMRIGSLNCSNAEIRHLEPLWELNFLKDLNCSNTQIDSLEPLRNTHFLLMLNCSKTNINTLDPLRQLNLERLNCSETQISSLKPLWGMSNLKVLDCQKTLIEHNEVERFKQECPQCKVNHKNRSEIERNIDSEKDLHVQQELQNKKETKEHTHQWKLETQSEKKHTPIEQPRKVGKKSIKNFLLKFLTKLFIA